MAAYVAAYVRRANSPFTIHHSPFTNNIFFAEKEKILHSSFFILNFIVIFATANGAARMAPRSARHAWAGLLAQLVRATDS